MDAMVGHLRDGELVVVVGRPASGRTSLLLGIAAHVAAVQRRPVAVFGAPHPAAHVRARMIDLLSGRLRDRSRHGCVSSEESVVEARRLIDAAHLTIDDQSFLTVEDLAVKIFYANIRAGRQNGLTVILDPQLVEGQPHARSSELALALRVLGWTFGGAILCEVQLRWIPPTEATADPGFFGLTAGVGALVREASAVVVTHRPAVHLTGARTVEDAYILVTKSPPTRGDVIPV